MCLTNDETSRETQCSHDKGNKACSTLSLTGYEMTPQDPTHLQNHPRIESQDVLDDTRIIPKPDITPRHGENPSCTETLKRRPKDSKHDQREMAIRSNDEANPGYFASDSGKNFSENDDDCDEDDNLSFGSKEIKASGKALLEDPLIIFGFDISFLSRNMQYYVCATGAFGFTLVYSYLQEMISVHILGRKYALFFATCQFAGYSFWSFALLQLRVWRMNKTSALVHDSKVCERETASLILKEPFELSLEQMTDPESCSSSVTAAEEVTLPPNISKDKKRISEKPSGSEQPSVLLFIGLSQMTDPEFCSSNVIAAEEVTLPPNISKDKKRISEKPSGSEQPSVLLFIGLSLMRAVDLGMTNSAMRFINYPAKTLIKSSRSAFTITIGVMMGKKGYSRSDYVMVVMLITGLVVFLRADKNSDAIFHPYGVILLVISLSCDGVVGNSSEILMRQHRMSQDQFQLSIYSISFIAMLLATIVKGEFFSGIQNFFLLPGTIPEIIEAPSGLYHHHREGPTWTAGKKCIAMLMFTLMGLLGSSCAGALTKEFGALSMSVISTNRKAITLFLSFMSPGFNNRCTVQHVIGMVIFLSGTSIRGFPKIQLFNSKGTVAPEKQLPPSPNTSILIV